MATYEQRSGSEEDGKRDKDSDIVDDEIDRADDYPKFIGTVPVGSSDDHGEPELFRGSAIPEFRGYPGVPQGSGIRRLIRSFRRLGRNAQ